MVRDTLLIVDDSELDLAILNEIFKGLFQVECCTDANKAVSFVQKHAERICAVLVDICLGRRGAGFTLLHRMQTNPVTTGLPIILITSDANKDDVLSGVEQGAVDFLVKPVDPHSVQDRVCSIVRRIWPEGETVLDQPAQPQEEAPPSAAQGRFCLLGCLPEQLTAEQAEQLVDGWTEKLALLCKGRPGVRLIQDAMIPQLTGLLAAAWGALYPASGMTQLQAAYVQQAARLCDVGLLGLPDTVAAGSAGQPEEGQDAYMRHTELGRKLFEIEHPHPFVQICAEVAQFHHKNFDGTGYPATEGAVQVPLSAQLVHAAFRCARYLRKYDGHSDCCDRALRALASEAGSILSPEMVHAIEQAREGIAACLPQVGVRR